MPLQKVRKFEKVCQIIEHEGKQPSRLIPILQAVQEEYRYLPADILAFIASVLGVPSAQVFGVATFYSHFTLEPKGKYVIKVCDGTACHVKKSHGLLEVLRKKLELNETRTTTQDMLFTVETVSCLGACGLAPVLMVNEDVHGQMTPEKTESLIVSLMEKEMKNEPLCTK